MDYNSNIDLLNLLPRFSRDIVKLIRSFLAPDPRLQMRHICKIIEFAYPFHLQGVKEHKMLPVKWIEKHYLYCPCMGIVDKCEEKIFGLPVYKELWVPPPAGILNIVRNGVTMDGIHGLCGVDPKFINVMFDMYDYYHYLKTQCIMQLGPYYGHRSIIPSNYRLTFEEPGKYTITYFDEKGNPVDIGKDAAIYLVSKENVHAG